MRPDTDGQDDEKVVSIKKPTALFKRRPGALLAERTELGGAAVAGGAAFPATGLLGAYAGVFFTLHIHRGGGGPLIIFLGIISPKRHLNIFSPLKK